MDENADKITVKGKKIIRVTGLLTLDCVVILLVSFLSLFIRFEMHLSSIPAQYFYNYTHYLPILVISTLVIFALFGLYNSLWQFAGMQEVAHIVIASFIAALFYFAGSNFINLELPKSSYILCFLLLVFFTISSRFFYRMVRFVIQNRIYYGRVQSDKIRKIMVIGAGEAGSLIINEIQRSSLFRDERIVCAIDDSIQKVGSYIAGVKIVGTRKSIISAAKQYQIDEIIFAIPSAGAEEKQRILALCKETGCDLKTLPSLQSMINRNVNLKSIRSVDIEDLLFREPVQTDLKLARGYVKDRVVLVTGGGGSIGSELCRQIAIGAPRQLIIFDICENGAYDIQMELKARHPQLNLVTLIGSVRDTKRIDAVYDKYRPDIVFHAAAHKHVPLMEDSPNESVKNNIFGTLKNVQAADKYGAKKFVLISTDKAVNPTNIMGATKRVCEMIVQAYNGRSKTDFVAVRFGNVLGSNGSVVPLFKKQIENGGPITVTHPDIIRYFMTIKEAVSLVMQAAVYAKGGEIFVLDMGKPVRIVELAENLIRLSGYVPYEDIDIQFTGLRPGEKLYEELLMDEEGLAATQSKLIFIGKPIEFDEKDLFEKLSELYTVMMDDSINMRRIMQEIVPTYNPQNNKDPDDAFIQMEQAEIRRQFMNA